MDKIFVTKSSMPPLEDYVEMIKPLWDSHWLTNMGKYHAQLEKELTEYSGVDYLSLTVNGHMALELAIQLWNFPEGSEVITTPFTFISTTHAIIRNRLKPVFCDIKDNDFTIDENKIENLITEKTVAIVAVHVYGNPCNVKKIEEIANKYNLRVIYDAAHAFGEKLNGRGIGSFGDCSIFSFHATKVYNTIEGGAVCCHTQSVYEKLYNLKNFGIRSEELIVSVGANAKMNEFSAVMGLCNLKYIDEEIRKRKQAVEIYCALLGNMDKIRLNHYIKGLTPNYAYFPVVFQTKNERDYICNVLSDNNIYARKYFYPLTSDAACFKNKYKFSHLKKARYYADRILVLPLSADLDEETIDRISKIIISNLNRY